MHGLLLTLGLMVGCIPVLRAQSPSVTITVTEPSLPTADRPRGSTLAPFAFEANITDSKISTDNIDLFTNAKNSHKEASRKQNVFMSLQREVDGTFQDVDFILFETGTAGSQGATSLFLEVIPPFPTDQRKKRIEKAFSRSSKGDFIPETERIAFFDMWEQTESRPGKYRVIVTYDSPSGSVSSSPHEFTIEDKGNLYLKILDGIQDKG